MKKKKDLTFKETIGNKNKFSNKGITLIALVITIIVLLILAGVTIATLTGQDGLLTRASQAKNAQDKAVAYEKVAVEVLGSYDEDGILRAETLKSNIEAHIGGSATLGTENGFPVMATVDGYTFQVKEDGSISELNGISIPSSLEIPKDESVEIIAYVSYFITEDIEWQIEDDGVATLDKTTGSKVKVTAVGEIGSSTKITAKVIHDGEEYKSECIIRIKNLVRYASESESYVGYYADLDGDPDNGVDGIIYADLAIGGTGLWGNFKWGNYEYTAEKGGLKKYTIGNEVEADEFGSLKKPVISAVKNSNGKDRFYVMALEDIDNSTHYWYHNAYEKLPNGKLTEETDGRVVDGEENDFGTGKENTKYWLGKYNTIEEATEDSNDMWNIIQSDESKSKYPLEKWFVPSKSEWSAFGDMMFKSIENGGIGTNSTEFTKYGLNDRYFSSSQRNEGYHFSASFREGSIRTYRVDDTELVRLSTTF